MPGSGKYLVGKEMENRRALGPAKVLPVGLAKRAELSRGSAQGRREGEPDTPAACDPRQALHDLAQSLAVVVLWVSWCWLRSADAAPREVVWEVKPILPDALYRLVVWAIVAPFR
jgi:hypothetical protein